MTNRLPRLRTVALALAAAIAFGSEAQAAPCATNCLAAGDYTIAAVPGGLPRSYLVHVPASYTGQAGAPLLLDYHGFSSYAAAERKYSGQLQQSDKRGFIAVWPEGVALSWSAYGCCAVGDAARADDVGFLRSVIAAVKRRADIDDARVFVTGMSNGGGMACEAADIVRAVASVSFPLNSDRCHPARPIGVTEIAGTADETIAYDGSATAPLPNDVAGMPLGVQGARESLAAWKRLDGCGDDLTRTRLPAASRAERYRTCGGGVKVGPVTIVEGPPVLCSGHVGLGYTGTYTAPIEADYIWDHVFDL